MQDYFNSLIKALVVECAEISTVTGVLKQKPRRRRRVTATGVTLQSHSPEHIVCSHQSPVVELPHNRNIIGNIPKIDRLFPKRLFVQLLYELMMYFPCCYFLVPDLRTDNSAILSWVLLIAVLCLMIINGLLYYKLWSIEEAATYTITDLHVLK